MDYQQSIKNLSHLKNFARAWAECHLFFFFYSETEYEIEIYGLIFTDEQQSKIDKNFYSGLPYAYMSCKNTGEEILHYRDKNIDADYDLFSEAYSVVFCSDPADKKILQHQFFLLAELIKNK
jgi:hypothetical protein